MNTKIQHDATTLGPLTADSTMAGRLAALPDLVRFIAARDGRTLRDAAILLGDSLGAAADSLELFQTDGGAHARPVTDAAAMLAELRANWSALQGRPLDLTEEPFARLAMRASGAGELFGFGIAHEPTPWLPGALPVHDVNRWGMNRTSEARPRDLVRVADIVPAAAQRGSATTGGLPLDRAAAWVLDGLRQLDAVPWFELRPGREPLALEQCREWRPAYASSAQRRVEYLNSLAELPGFLFLADQPDAEEAAARGLAGSEDTWPAVIGESLNWPALPALIGPDGLREWLHTHWVERVGSADDSTSVRAFLAVPAAAVAQLTWVREDAASAIPAAQILSIAPQLPVDSRVVQPVGSAWPRATAASWTEAECAAMRGMRVNGMSDQEIAGVVGCKRQQVSQKIGTRQAARSMRSLTGQLSSS